jgi:23S rRNA (guanosine2251-2'-O)-methyltransferase
MSVFIYGRNAVKSSLSSGRVKTLYISDRLKNDSFTKSIYEFKPKDVRFVSEATLAKLASSPSNQGIVAEVEDYKTYSLNELIEGAKRKPYPLLVMLDGIEDPHNLGAILRSADAFGVDGVIMKSRGEVSLNGTVAKVSTGAIDYVKVSVVSNLNQSINTLKKAGYWIVASDGSATTLYDSVDYKCPIVLIVGSEGFGVSRLVLENSDFVTKIPMCGHVNSLNASVATSIYLSAIEANRRTSRK